MHGRVYVFLRVHEECKHHFPGPWDISHMNFHEIKRA